MRLPKRNSSSQLRGPRRNGTTGGFHRLALGLGGHAGRRVFAGVDIGCGAVKLVELSRPVPSAQTLHARTWGVEPLPPGAVETANAGANISDPGAVGEAIRRLRARIGAKARSAALAVPYSIAVTKTLRMDAGLTDEEMEVEVALEAERQMPFPAEEMALDFEPAQLCLDDPALVEVDVVACHLEQVRQREAAAAAGGLKAAVVELDTTALARAAHWLCPPSAGAPPLFVAALGAHTTTLLATNGEEVVFARQEPSAGVREGLAPRMKKPSAGAARERAGREGLAPRMEEPSAGVREGLAPRMKEPSAGAARGRAVREGLAPAKEPWRDAAPSANETLASELPDAPSAAVEGLVQEIARLTHLGANAPGVAAPARLLLVGARAGTPGLAALAAQRLGLVVNVADPAAQLGADMPNPPLDGASPQLMTACGLAQRGWMAFAAEHPAAHAPPPQEDSPP